MKSITKGYILGAIAAVSYGTNPLFAVPLYGLGLSVGSVLFYRYLFATLLLGLVMWRRGNSFHLTRRQIPLMMIQGVLFALSSVGLFEAYKYMDVGLASTMLFVEPVMVALLLWIFYREKISLSVLCAIIISFTGIVLIANPGHGANVLAKGVAYVMFASLVYAIYMVLINKTSLQRLGGTTLTFYSLLFGLSVMIVKVDFLTQLQPVPMTPIGIGSAIGLSLFPTIISILTVAVAVQLVGSVSVSILGALEPVTGLIIGVLLFGEILTVKAGIGVVLILLSVIVLVSHPRKILKNGKAVFHHFRVPGRR